VCELPQRDLSIEHGRFRVRELSRGELQRQCWREPMLRVHRRDVFRLVWKQRLVRLRQLLKRSVFRGRRVVVLELWSWDLRHRGGIFVLY